jgi:hypothetical protein
MALSNLPERNLFFTGREDVLAQLQEALATQGRAALSGLGGVGKTQTAVEYAYRHLDEYVYALWLKFQQRYVKPHRRPSNAKPFGIASPTTRVLIGAFHTGSTHRHKIMGDDAPAYWSHLGTDRPARDRAGLT